MFDAIILATQTVIYQKLQITDSEAQIIPTKNAQKIVRTIHFSKSMGKDTVVRTKQNVRIVQWSHYPGSTVQGAVRLLDTLLVE